MDVQRHWCVGICGRIICRSATARNFAGKVENALAAASSAGKMPNG
jgi:hypothetical protein